MDGADHNNRYYSCYPLVFYHHGYFDNDNNPDELLQRTLLEYNGLDDPRNRTVTDIQVTDSSVTTIDRFAFANRTNLIEFSSRNNLHTIGDSAFDECHSLVNVSIPGLVTVETAAFYSCHNLCNIEFGESLQSIGNYAFYEAMEYQGTHLNLPKVRSIGLQAFQRSGLSEIVCSNQLERIGNEAFDGCQFLKRVVIPLKTDLFRIGGGAFCIELVRDDLVIELVQEVHDIVDSLFIDSWKDSMRSQLSLYIPSGHHATDLTFRIHEWLVRTDSDLNQYKEKQYNLLKEVATLLELAIWKWRIEYYEEERYFLRMRSTLLTWIDYQPKKRAKIDRFARSELRYLPGSEVIISNVMSYL